MLLISNDFVFLHVGFCMPSGLASPVWPTLISQAGVPVGETRIVYTD